MVLQFDRELIARYDRPGPRYTSYPAAPCFRNDFGADEFRGLVASGNHDPIPRPLSLYFHIPFCTSPCFYCACNRIITREAWRGEQYLGYLKREIAMYAGLIDRDRRVEQIHFGGGTPNFLSPEQLGDLLDEVARHFCIAGPEQREIAIEIDPRHVTAGELAQLRAQGFNRLSFGIQDFDPAVQQTVNRIQPSAETLALMNDAARLGFHSTNVDLMYGLPRQSPAGLARTLEQVAAVRPDRIALYAYAHMPQHFKGQRHIPTETLPSAEERLGLFVQAAEHLDRAGYVHIGMDHFALPSDPLARAWREGTLIRNFQGYATGNGTDILAMGVTGISQLANGFAANARDLSTYYQCIDRKRPAVSRGLFLSDEDRLRGEIIQAIMCRGRVRYPDIEARHGIDFGRHFAAELRDLQPLEEDGLVEFVADGFRVTEAGRLLLRHPAMVFDEWLRAREGVDAARPSGSRII